MYFSYGILEFIPVNAYLIYAKLKNDKSFCCEEVRFLASDMLTFFSPSSDPKSTEGALESCQQQNYYIISPKSWMFAL